MSCESILRWRSIIKSIISGEVGSAEVDTEWVAQEELAWPWLERVGSAGSAKLASVIGASYSIAWTLSSLTRASRATEVSAASCGPWGEEGTLGQYTWHGEKREPWDSTHDFSVWPKNSHVEEREMPKPPKKHQTRTKRLLGSEKWEGWKEVHQIGKSDRHRGLWCWEWPALYWTVGQREWLVWT